MNAESVVNEPVVNSNVTDVRSREWAASSSDYYEEEASDGGAFQPVVNRRRVKRQRIHRSDEQTSDQAGSNEAAGSSRPEATAAGECGRQGRQGQGRQGQRRKPLLVGKNRDLPATIDTPSFTAAKPFYGKAVYYVDNGDLNMTESDLLHFVSKTLSVRVLSCYEVKARQTAKQRLANQPADHRSFRLCINKADSQLLLNEDKWMADVAIWPWHFKDKKKNEKDTTVVVKPAADGHASPALPDDSEQLGATAASTPRRLPSTSVGGGGTTSGRVSDDDANNIDMNDAEKTILSGYHGDGQY